jgi:hypothetical protein
MGEPLWAQSLAAAAAAAPPGARAAIVLAYQIVRFAQKWAHEKDMVVECRLAGEWVCLRFGFIAGHDLYGQEHRIHVDRDWPSKLPRDLHYLETDLGAFRKETNHG